MELISGLIAAVVVLLLVGSVVGAVCALFVFLMTRGVVGGRSGALSVGFKYPIWVGLYLLASLVIIDLAQLAQGKDSILNGVYHIPLANGYQLVYFDEFPESAHVDGVGRMGTVVGNVRAFQVDRDLVFVSYYSGNTDIDAGEGKPANRFAVVDTRLTETKTYPTHEDLRAAASRKGVSLVLAPPSQSLKLGRRGLWILSMLMVPPIMGAVYLLRKLSDLRRSTLVAAP
jgi:hypothetical protein